MTKTSCLLLAGGLLEIIQRVFQLLAVRLAANQVAALQVGIVRAGVAGGMHGGARLVARALAVAGQRRAAKDILDG